jgi:hypothetical protein
MMKPKLLKPRMPYLWEFLIADDHAVPMRKARKFLTNQLAFIEDDTKVRIYIRIEKDGGKKR